MLKQNVQHSRLAKHHPGIQLCVEAAAMVGGFRSKFASIEVDDTKGYSKQHPKSSNSFKKLEETFRRLLEDFPFLRWFYVTSL